MHYSQYTAHNFSCRPMVSYGVKSYYFSNFHSTVCLNRIFHACILISRDILYQSTWNFYSVSSNSKRDSPLIWFHSVHSWLCANLGKFTFETTLVNYMSVTVKPLQPFKGTLSFSCSSVDLDTKKVENVNNYGNRTNSIEMCPGPSPHTSAVVTCSNKRVLRMTFLLFWL